MSSTVSGSSSDVRSMTNGAGGRANRNAYGEAPCRREELQPALGVVDCRELTGPDPPQHDPGAARREPLAPSGEELGVDGSVGEVLERRDRRPDRHVHDDHRVGIRAKRGGVALVGLEPPHEAG